MKRRRSEDARAASSSTNVPMTSVLRNSPAARIDRSTCVSAAKCTTISDAFTSGAGDLRVCDVAAHEPVARIVEDVVERLHPAGVGQFVECRDAPVGMSLERVTHEVAANEAGAACHEDFHHHLSPETTRGTARDSTSGGQLLSRSDTNGLLTGQSIPSAGSFHMTPASYSGEYSVDV